MNIGIDLDGVVYDTENDYRTRAKIYDIEHNNGLGEVKKEESRIQQMFDWSKEMTDEFLQGCYEDIQSNAPLKFGAKYVIEKLREMGHKLYVITSRGSLSQKEIDITKKRFEEDGLVFDGCYFNCKTKEGFCKDLNIDVMIDDYYNNIDDICKEKIRCLYFREIVLKFYNGNRYVHEVRNWGDIYYEILNFDKWKV